MNVFSILLLIALPMFFPYELEQVSLDLDTQELVGLWELDMTPENKNDNNFAMMRITKVNARTFEGSFYRDGVQIRNGQLNTQRGLIYGALMSGDNSGDYCSSFYYQDGILYGSTHAIQRNFLSVWTARKVKN